MYCVIVVIGVLVALAVIVFGISFLSEYHWLYSLFYVMSCLFIIAYLTSLGPSPAESSVTLTVDNSPIVMRSGIKTTVQVVIK